MPSWQINEWGKSYDLACMWFPHIPSSLFHILFSIIPLHSLYCDPCNPCNGPMLALHIIMGGIILPHHLPLRKKTDVLTLQNTAPWETSGITRQCPGYKNSWTKWSYTRIDVSWPTVTRKQLPLNMAMFCPMPHHLNWYAFISIIMWSINL